MLIGSFEPRDPRRATLSGDITDSATTFDVEGNTWTAHPTSGMILIEDELMAFTGYSDGIFSGVTRGIEGTIAKLHLADAAVLWVDHIITQDLSVLERPIDDLDIETDFAHLFNHVTIEFGDREKTEARDPDSIAEYGVRPFSLQVPLSSQQGIWAEWLRDVYLERFKDLHDIVNIELKSTFYMKLGEIVLIRQLDRLHFFTPCQSS